MAYDVIWSPKALDGLRALQKDDAGRIVKKVRELELAPYHFAERMADANAWKVRIGDYRAIVDIDEKEKRIIVLKVGHRKNIYKRT